MKYAAYYRKGQTLIEALIALSVITTGFLGVMTLLSKSFFYDRVISDQLTGTYLASEGVEVAKSLVDHDVFSGAAWGACFSAYDNGGAGVAQLALDYTSVNCGTLQNYSSDMKLNFDPTTEQYSYQSTAGSIASNFSRNVRIAQHGDQIVVDSIVTWNTGPVTSQSVDLEDVFYNWRQ